MIGFFGKTLPTYPLIMGPIFMYQLTIKIIALTSITVIETSVLALYQLVYYFIFNLPLLCTSSFVLWRTSQSPAIESIIKKSPREDNQNCIASFTTPQHALLHQQQIQLNSTYLKSTQLDPTLTLPYPTWPLDETHHLQPCLLSVLSNSAKRLASYCSFPCVALTITFSSLSICDWPRVLQRKT